MFNWLRNRRRNIFRYWDGRRRRGIDPAVAWRRMYEDPECVPDHDFGPACGIGSDGEPVKFDSAAQQRVLKLARSMFELQEWSNERPGLTVDETFALLWSFLAYMNELKKKRAPLPTRSPRSGSESSAPNSTTQPASDFSSTEIESKSVELSSSSKRSFHL